jgi:hypothetical protein
MNFGAIATVDVMLCPGNALTVGYLTSPDRWLGDAACANGGLVPTDLPLALVILRLLSGGDIKPLVAHYHSCPQACRGRQP